MKWMVSLSLLTLTAFLWGCGGSNSGLNQSTTRDSAIGRSINQVTAPYGLQVKLSTDKTVYHSGEAIQIDVAVTNPTSSLIHVNYPTPPPTIWWGYAVVQNGRVVTWEWWPGHKLVTTQQIVPQDWNPGQTIHYSLTFPQSIAPGLNDSLNELAPGTYHIYPRTNLTLTNMVSPTGDDVIGPPVTITVVQ
ncbi:MAG: BsuPI-related putative proteinase inhibitor [Armatimonadetes bacterium]|nr:BsuPI-related putative proteinase inhibitor [Armatimonadota bacterium]